MGITAAIIGVLLGLALVQQRHIAALNARLRTLNELARQAADSLDSQQQLIELQREAIGHQSLSLDVAHENFNRMQRCFLWAVRQFDAAGADRLARQFAEFEVQSALAKYARAAPPEAPRG